MSGAFSAPDYTALTLDRFLDLVASREPAPGGGASAAITVALAAALCSMSARFSADHLADASELVDRCEHLRERAAQLAQADAEAYGRVLAALRLPRDGRVDRKQRISEAYTEATDVPLAMAEAGATVAEIAARLAREGNPNLRGDALSAALLAEAGVRAAAELVKINAEAGNIPEDRPGQAEELVRKVAAAARTAEDNG